MSSPEEMAPSSHKVGEEELSGFSSNDPPANLKVLPKPGTAEAKKIVRSHLAQQKSSLTKVSIRRHLKPKSQN